MPDSAAASNPSVNGGMLLFKLKLESFVNRPLELVIKDPADPSRTGSIDLDV